MNLKHLHSYLAERFPLVNMLLFAILYFTVMNCSLYFTGQPFHFGALDALGVLAINSFFFRLRVFDEFKDFEIDNVLHPQRVLQTGRIGLQDLKYLSIILSLSEVIWSWFMGTNTFIFFTVALTFSILMRYEFFISAFLKKRLVLYAFTHMLIMPLIILWLWNAWQTEFAWSAPLLILMFLSIFGGFSFELSRKIHAPESEIEGQDSYSKTLGLKGAILAVLMVLLLGVITQFQLLNYIEARIWPYLSIGVLYLLAIFIYTSSWLRPKQSLFRKAELVVSLFMLISYLSIIIEILNK